MVLQFAEPTSSGCSRDPLVAAIATFLARDETRLSPRVRELLEREIDIAGPDALASLGAHLAAAGSDWAYYPRDPLARRIHHLLADHVLDHPPIVRGTEHLIEVADKPVVIVANHLSYSDANVIDVALEHSGFAAFARRLTVVAGPKVYSNIRRRFSSLCFGTIKVPQSHTRSSDEAVMQPRDVAQVARRSIAIAQQRLRLGDALLVFAEGTRSRSGDMQRLLPGVARYIDAPDISIIPAGLTGSESLFPIGEESLNPVRIALTIGRPISAGALFARGNRRLVMDAIGLAIARLLPPTYRGVYSDTAPDLDEARRLARELCG